MSGNFLKIKKFAAAGSHNMEKLLYSLNKRLGRAHKYEDSLEKETASFIQISLAY